MSVQKVDLAGGRGWAAPPAAASIHRIDAQLGRLADINEAGRSREKADENYRKWLAYQKGGPWAPYALPADKSVHVPGMAADSDDWYDPAAAAVWRDNGWRQTARYPSNPKKDEPWHGEYFAHLDNHLNDTHTPDPIALLGDTMGLRIIDSPFYRAAGYRVIHNGSAAMSVPAGHVQEMITLGRVDYATYEDNNLLETEVRMVWQLGGYAADAAAAKTAAMLKALEE